MIQDDPGFLHTDDDIFTQSSGEGEGEELSNEMKWRLDADATVEGYLLLVVVGCGWL